MENCMGGLNMKLKFILKTFKNRRNRVGGVVSNLGGLYPPRTGVKISLYVGSG